MKTTELEGKENPFLKGLCEDSLGQETSTKKTTKTNQKPKNPAHRPEMKETHLLTVEHLLERLGPLGLSLGTDSFLLSHSAMLILLLVDTILESAL